MTCGRYIHSLRDKVLDSEILHTLTNLVPSHLPMSLLHLILCFFSSRRNCRLVLCALVR